MSGNSTRLAGALLLVSLFGLPAPSQAPGKRFEVSKADLCITEGEIGQSQDGRLSVDVPKMRGYLKSRTPQAIEARFTYLGSTGHEAPLGSGEIRRQFGLKLRAQDACNLVYAMWRIEPESKLVVSVKANPGQHSSAECGNRGYVNIKPRHSTPVPVLRSGASHTLRVEMSGAEMKVFADNELVWEGSVGPGALAFDGPVGIRSDNARLQIDLRTAEPLKTQPANSGCKAGADSD